MAAAEKFYDAEGNEYVAEMQGGNGRFIIKAVPVKPKYETYYIRSNGEIVGPNLGDSLGKVNLERQEFGNLFTSRKQAEAARNFLRHAFDFMHHNNLWDDHFKANELIAMLRDTARIVQTATKEEK